ncbi:crotonase/enoyl-CoA hydratase family protein [Halioglobus maricola]|uniref:Crotonase/enoyl-CoA hydratase family protein n=1 Tax=Halioglobus maricola TaxID=2601894 RepID=A0A5P9NK44_9GAMM|nr:crotonase/enoyl-CoA hydratase family protein [Halioglobus maricola]QFU75614.1 crotonase/enoyl-CoA hydratase family protein [Halioglobus maricola]
MSDLVTIDIQNHVADVRLNRPEKMNALSWDMFDAITSAAKELASNRDVRAIVLSGEGKGFCAGMDLENFGAGLGQDPFGEGRGGFTPNYYQEPAYLWKAIPAPVICALHGAAYGGGFQIAMGADIRIAHPGTKLSLMEIKWGMIPDMSASQTLRDLVRVDVAKELAFTGRVLQGPEALDLGLVTRLSETPYDDARALAENIASKNPDAVARSKYMFETTWRGDSVDGLAAEERLQGPILGQSNQVESVMAALEGREPTFVDRAFGDFTELDGTA